MAFKKKISSTNIKVLKESEVVEEKKITKVGTFPVGFKFSLGGKVWTVLKEVVADNTPMRKIVGDDGTEEIVMLRTLQKDATADDFFLPPGK